MAWQTTVRENGMWKLNPAVRFATREEAEAYGRDLQERQVESYRVEEVEDTASYSFQKGELRLLSRAFPYPYS